MKQKGAKKQQAAAAKQAPKTKERPQIALGKKNYAIMAVGLVSIIVGFITLANGSITLAPLLLVLGYCVVIPVSLLVK